MTRMLLFTMLSVGCFASDLSALDRGERDRAFIRAQELFDAAQSPDEFRASASVLESILADGFRNGAVYYNLGNAYYRAGEFGRAILSYRKAKPYRPRDPYLIANLEQALAAAPGRLSDTPPEWYSHVLFWREWLTLPGKVQTVCVSLVAAALCWTLSVLRRDRRWNYLMFGLLVLSAALGVDAVISYVDATASHRAVITSETIARKGMGTSYEAAFDQPLRDGAEFTVLSETADWTFGHFANIGDGWVRNEFVAR